MNIVFISKVILIAFVLISSYNIVVMTNNIADYLRKGGDETDIIVTQTAEIAGKLLFRVVIAIVLIILMQIKGL